MKKSYPAIAKHGQGTGILTTLSTISPSCPRDLYVSQSDKHSDLTVFLKNGVTVMAVATDSHRDFLIPERTEKGVLDNERFVQMPCVYSFVACIIT